MSGEVQKKILKALMNHGGSAYSKEIEEMLNMKHDVVYMSCKHLITRGLIKRKTEEIRNKEKQPYFKRVNSYKIMPKQIHKIERLISEIEE